MALTYACCDQGHFIFCICTISWTDNRIITYTVHMLEPINVGTQYAMTSYPGTKWDDTSLHNN